MLEYFGSVLQSDEQFTGQNTNIDVTVFNNYSGGSRLKAHTDEMIKGKRGIITINNEDNFCMIRAIAVGHAINNNHPKLKTIKDSRKKAQLTEALEIIKNCDLLNEGPYSLDIITKITPYIKSNIIVFSRQEGNKVIYKSTLPYENKIYLLLYSPLASIIL